MNSDLIISFHGGEARQHRLESYEGIESLAGISRALRVAGHFVSTGQLRYRKPFDERLKLYIVASRSGSFEIVLAVAAGMGANALYDLVRAGMKRAVGKRGFESLETEVRHFSAGDVDAFSEAIHSPLLRGHDWIETIDRKIEIKKGSEIIAELDHKTKSYLKEEEVANVETVQDVSVAALNGNSRGGRVYFFDLERTIPFKVPRDATARTIPTLSRFLTQYVEKTGATVNIRFRKVEYQDGRLKRIIITDCYPIGEKE